MGWNDGAVLVAGDVPLAKPFGLVQAVVSQLDEVLSGGIADIAGDAGRKRHAPQRRSQLRAYGTFQAFQDLVSLLTRRLGQQEQEFVPAVAVHQVGGTDNLTDAGRKGPQQAVPLVVAQSVVDSLEAVEVQHGQAHVPMVPNRTLQFPGDHFIHHAAVEKPRKSVAGCLLAQLLCLLLVVDEQGKPRGKRHEQPDVGAREPCNLGRLEVEYTDTLPPAISGIASSDNVGHSPSMNSV